MERTGANAEEAERLLNSVTGYGFLLYGGTMAAGIAPHLAHRYAPRAVAAAASFASPNGYDATATLAVFAAATALLQRLLARVLERKPAPAPRLTPLGAWPLAVATWLCVTVFFLAYLSLGQDGGLVGRRRARVGGQPRHGRAHRRCMGQVVFEDPTLFWAGFLVNVYLSHMLIKVVGLVKH